MPPLVRSRSTVLVASSEVMVSRLLEAPVKVKAFEAIVAKFKEHPDKYASYSEMEKYTDDLKDLVDLFTSIPFDGSKTSDEAKRIIQLYENNIQGRYKGHLFNQVEGEVSFIVRQFLNR